MRSSNDAGATRHAAREPAVNARRRLHELAQLSVRLAEPARDLVILAEGNTSARIDDESFWVKASGTPLAQADQEHGYVAVRLAPLLEALRDSQELHDAEAKARLESAALRADGEARSPSIETYVHAACLELGAATFVAHTHPTALNAVLCSEQAETAYRGVLFPDEAVVCGPTPLLVPYAPPGLALGRAVLAGLEKFTSEHGGPPHTVLLGNHGLFALGASAEEVMAITEMVVKAARIRAGALAAGDLRFLAPDEADRLYRREDERARRQRLASAAP